MKLETHNKVHYNQTFKRQRENLESSKRQATCHIQRILNKIISRFLIRSFGGQKAVGQYIQNAKRKKKNHRPRILCLANCPSRMREKLRHFQVKSRGNLLPLDMPCKKSSREPCRVKQKDNRQ